MSIDWVKRKQECNQAILEGVKAAQDGLIIIQNPHERGYLHESWCKGFRFIKPDWQTSIVDVLTPGFGGPPKRERIYNYVKEDGMTIGKPTGYEIPVGPWVILENFTYTKDSWEVRSDRYADPKMAPKVGDPAEYNYVFQRHYLSDGIYDLTDNPYCYLEDAESDNGFITEEGLKFCLKYGLDNIYIAQGYEVPGVFLIAGKPKEFKNCLGSFGRGACAVFENCPRDLLIIAEND